MLAVCVNSIRRNEMLTYTAPGADIVGQDVEVHLSLTLPYNKSTWLKKAKAVIKYHYSTYQWSF